MPAWLAVIRDFSDIVSDPRKRMNSSLIIMFKLTTRNAVPVGWQHPERHATKQEALSASSTLRGIDLHVGGNDVGSVVDKILAKVSSEGEAHPPTPPPKSESVQTK